MDSLLEWSIGGLDPRRLAPRGTWEGVKRSLSVGGLEGGAAGPHLAFLTCWACGNACLWWSHTGKRQSLSPGVAAVKVLRSLKSVFPKLNRRPDLLAALRRAIQIAEALRYLHDDAMPGVCEEVESLGRGVSSLPF